MTRMAMMKAPTDGSTDLACLGLVSMSTVVSYPDFLFKTSAPSDDHEIALTAFLLQQHSFPIGGQ